MPVITLLNQKGGVGKTSTTHHLAGTLAALGRRVLLLDNDPQASLSQGFWGPDATAALDGAETIAAVYAGEAIADRIVRPSGIAGIDLVPGSIDSTEHNTPAPYRAPWDAQTCLRSFLDDIRGRYDVTLIDCPPNLHLCSWAALVASDHLIVPLQPEDYGAQGLGPVQASVDLVAAGPNPGLNLLGFLVTMYNARLTLHRLYDEKLRERYGRAVFEARVPYAVDIKEAIAQRRPIAFYKPKGASAKAIKSLADEVLARLAEPPSAGNQEAA